ncbi:MAG: 5-(carboxyamino)imidazole ribonucleotide synthase, partial [Gammaproteobacteria bacterium]
AAQDRLVEKNFFRSLDIDTPDYAPVETLDDLKEVMASMGYPAILKSRRLGYDGKGQSILRAEEDLQEASERMDGAPAIVEGFVPFDREVSIIAARRVSGDMAYYPLSENVHRGGILRVAECRYGDALQGQAEAYVTRLMEALDYVGVLAHALFEIDGRLIANEFAPRVHNSGHWTIEGAETSQFENHLRAILDMPLGSTAPVGRAAMVNFIGGVPEPGEVLALPRAHLHLYDKAPRKGRKVAHATVRSENPETLDFLLEQLTALADRVDDS